jgi:hypothetical protein
VAVCRDPAMPGFSTVYRWRRTFADFGKALAEAREVQAERLCDLGLEVAEGVTPATAHATAVRLVQMRWTAGVLSPRRYGRFRPVEADLPAQVQTVLLRHFTIERHPETGQRRVVGYTPDPSTMTPRIDSEGPWGRLPKVADLSDEGRGTRAVEIARTQAWMDEDED